MSYFLIIPVAVCAIFATMVWLVSTARQFSRKQNELNLADKQLAVYNQRRTSMRGGPEAQLSTEQAELSLEIYQSVAIEYNRCLAKAANRPIAWLLEYHPVSEVKDI